MPRLMSVSHTTPQVIDRSKTVTRRLGWTFLAAGDRLTLCEKVMGRKHGEPLVRLAEVEVVSVRRQPLCRCTDDDAAREGFPAMTGEDFIAFFCDTFGAERYTPVTRIEWRYLDDDERPAP